MGRALAVLSWSFDTGFMVVPGSMPLSWCFHGAIEVVHALLWCFRDVAAHKCCSHGASIGSWHFLLAPSRGASMDPHGAAMEY